MEKIRLGDLQRDVPLQEVVEVIEDQLGAKGYGLSKRIQEEIEHWLEVKTVTKGDVAHFKQGMKAILDECESDVIKAVIEET